MKIKIKDCYDIANVMQALGAKELPIKLAYWIKRISKFIDVELRIAEEVRHSIFKKRGIEIDPKTKNYKVAEYLKEKPAEEEVMNKESSDLMDGEIDFPFNKLKLKAFGDINIAPAILEGIDSILDGEEDATKS